MECIPWITRAMVGLVVLTLVSWAISNIDFKAPLTAGGSIVIACLVLIVWRGGRSARVDRQR
jgi:hypothetical protein